MDKSDGYMKRDSTYTRGTWRSMRINDLLSPLPFIVISWDPWIKKRVNYLSCIEGKGVWKLLLYCTKCHVNCCSIIKYLLLYACQILNLLGKARESSFEPDFTTSIQKSVHHFATQVLVDRLCDRCILYIKADRQVDR